MSSKLPKNKLHEKNFDYDLEISEFILSFKDVINQIHTVDIYSGEENIPFSKKEVEFRKILISEFLT